MRSTLPNLKQLLTGDFDTSVVGCFLKEAAANGHHAC